MINIILSGGSGTRLWPLSRTMLPKQFVRLFNGESLFQKTIKRNFLCERFLIVTNQDQYFLAVDQLNGITDKSASFLLEPIGRNTAPAIALACLTLEADEIVLVTTSDHIIKDKEAYEQALLEAKSLAKLDNIVTFGIKPTYPEVGFGYIETDGTSVLSFKEKPDIDTAKLYVESGNYCWNSGMFCFKAGVYLQELKKHAPNIFEAALNAINHSKREGNCYKVNLEMMQTIPENSIDYAVLEKSKCVKVVKCDIGWSDLGSFDALYEETKHEQNQNAVILRQETTPVPICIDSKYNLVVSRDRQVALIDVDDLLVVDTKDALLISKKGSSQKVKELVAQIKKSKPELTDVHRLAYRPWGSYEVLVDTVGYKVKRIIVKVGGRLSLQKHFHRNEHWIVVSGTATVTVENDIFLLRPNESTYIKMGQMHRLENHGKIDLTMIEVQVGEYTGEDDIVRVEDIYGR